MAEIPNTNAQLNIIAIFELNTAKKYISTQLEGNCHFL